MLLSVLGTPIVIFLSTLFSGYLAVALFSLHSIFFGLRNPVIDDLLNKEVDSSKRATILSTRNFANQLGLAFAIPLIGYFADLYTINTAFKIITGLMLLSFITFSFLKKDAGRG